MADPEIRSTPEKYPTVGALSRLLGRVDKFARAPFGYSNPPVEMLSDLLEIPALYRTGENIAYGSPLTIGAGQARRMTEDTTGAIGGALNLIGPAASTAKLAVKGTKAIAPRAGALAQKLAVRTQPMPLQMNIVKPKGGAGNWLAGSLEPVTKPLKTRVPTLDRYSVRAVIHPDDLGRYYAAADAPGVTDIASQLKTAGLYEKYMEPNPVNKWIDKKLNPYIKNEMGTPEDPVRALAEEGILHYQPRQMAEDSTFMRIVNENRARGGFPSEDAATTPLGKLWERYADYAISPMQAGSRLSKNEQDLSNYRNTQPIEKENPWLLKVPPETQVYDLTNYGDAYGFPHLVDELKAAVSPTSELPANLRLTVEQLDKVTMPQAVKRVAEINAWRAKQAAEAEKQGLMTNLQATPRLKDESMQLSFVEKPGATWVDVPETVTEDGVKLCTSLGKAGGWCTQNEGSARSYGSGSNRLTTLIDAEGRPHAQAKITQNMSPYDTWYASQKQGSEELLDFERWLQDNHAQNPKARKTGGLEGMYEKWASETGRAIAQPVPKIDELKPPGNSFTSERSTEYLRRDPDYKAKVTDSVLKFLNSGTWGKVNDLQHYDIADLKDSNSITNAINNLYPGDFQKGADAFNMAADMEPNTPRFMSKSQLREFIEPSTKPEGFAEGGRVEKEMSQVSDDPIGDFLYDYEMEKLRKKIAENEAALIDLTPVPTTVETGSDPMLLDVYPRLKRKMEANPELYKYGTAELKDKELTRPMLSEDASREAWLEYKLRPRGQTDYSDKYPPGIELLEENNYYPRFGKRQPPRFKDKTPWDGYYAQGGLVEYDPDHIESLAQSFDAEEFASGGAVHMAEGSPAQKFGKGGVVKKVAELLKGMGVSEGKVASKELTTLQDAHTSLGDSIRERTAKMQQQMDEMDFKYNSGQYVFTEGSAKNNRPPLVIKAKRLYGNEPMREPHPVNPLMGKVIKDPATGLTKRTPYEPGYLVRREGPEEDWSEFVIPQSAIKGSVDNFAHGGMVQRAEGGAVHMAEGGDAASTALDLYSQINRSGENIDAGGLQYWTERAQSNQQSPEELQKEFMAAADSSDDPYYEVNKMYQRTAQTPDTEGFNYWVNRAQQEKLTPQQLGQQFIGGMPAITAAQERSGFGSGGQYGTYNGLPMLYAPEVDRVMDREQRVTGDLVNKDNSIGWDPSSMSGELSRGAAAAGVYRAPLGMGMQGQSQFSGDLQGIAKQYGVDPEQYMQSSVGQYGQANPRQLDENALYSALDEKMKDYYAVQGYVPPAGTENSAFNRTDIGGDHARVMYQRYGDRLVPIENTLQYSDMQRAPKYSWTDYIAPAAIVAAPWALPYIAPYFSAAGMGKYATMSGIKNLIHGKDPISGAIEGAASSFLPSPFEEVKFAEGGAVNYNQSHIDELAERFHKEM